MDNSIPVGKKIDISNHVYDTDITRHTTTLDRQDTVFIMFITQRSRTNILKKSLAHDFVQHKKVTAQIISAMLYRRTPTSFRVVKEFVVSSTND